VGSVLFPHVEAGAGWVRSNDPVFAFGTKLRQGRFTEGDFALDVLNDPSAIDDWTASARIRWSLLDPAAWVERDVAAKRTRASSWDRRRVAEATDYRTKVFYFQSLAAEGRLRAAQSGEEAARATYARFQSRNARGLLTRADLLQAEAELRAAEALRLEAARQLQESRELLGLHLGWDPAAVPVPADPLPDAVEPGEIGIALESRSDLRMLAALRTAADAQVRRAGFAYLPAVDVFAGVQSHAADAFESDGSNWNVGVALRWSLFAGLGRLAGQQQAAAARQQARIQYDAALRSARSEVSRSKQAVSTSLIAVSATRAARDAAAEAQRLMRRRFEDGLATPADLLQAEARAVEMNTRSVEALASFHIAKARLEFATARSAENESLAVEPNTEVDR
jgi:outer membrane protein TolC